MSQVIYDSKYINDTSMRDYNIFAEEYFSGSDIKLTANNTTIKQISMIQYELQEQLKPIYGYNSYIYDEIAVGSRIVTGTFVCPMRNLATNEEFKCGTSKSTSYSKNSYNSINSNNSKDQSKSQFNIKVNNEPIYLESSLMTRIGTLNDEDVIVKAKLGESALVYSKSNNINGYIKAGDF